MPCNVINNAGFEAGLESWYPSSGSQASIVTGDGNAYAGNSYLDLETTTLNPGGFITQDLYWLDDANEHKLTVAVQIRDPIPTTGSCIVSAFLGSDPEAGEFASDIIWNGGEWVLLQGSVQPTERDTTINLAATCTFEGEATAVHVLWDDVVFDDC
ncbi:hypothetical protein BJY04DRAFT_154036 [Aspergillus karnatakaensis]|uniref:uncharacterized protein n=1 Tax=Aspergillus karnatakaensis TaxID=1810916 RepID=UPI003CCD8050